MDKKLKFVVAMYAGSTLVTEKATFYIEDESDIVNQIDDVEEVMFEMLDEALEADN